MNGFDVYVVGFHSEGLHSELSEEERQFWHHHNFEVLSGQLVAPGLPDVARRPSWSG